MTAAQTLPTFRGKRFNCPRCQAFAGQDFYDVLTQHRNSYVVLKDGVDVTMSSDIAKAMPGPRWYLSQCASCQHVAIWRGDVMVFPSKGEDAAVPDPAPDMPAEAEELYREAAATLAVSRRAAAALCRAALESLVRRLTADAPSKSRLDDRLALLSRDVSQPVWEVLQAVRHIGNTALHGADDTDESIRLYLDDTDPQVPLMFFEAMNMLVDERIVRPARAASLFSKLPQGVQDAIQNKRDSLSGPMESAQK